MTSDTFGIGRTVFGRALGLCSFIAFVSIWVQLHGLVGEQGILPASDYLDRVLSYTGSSSLTWEAFWLAPSLFWFSTDDAFIHVVCALGSISSLVLLAGFVPRWAALSAWTCYLSICSVGQVFLGYQWDALLLETLFVGAFFVPGGLSLATEKKSGPMLWVVWLLLFKLMFLSGFVKLASRDENWAGFSALDFHFWSQPLPTWSAYYVDALPSFLLMLACILTLVIEVVVPFGIVLGKWGRRSAAIAFTLLMLGILASGNYGFFNILTLVLIAALLDDELIQKAWPASEQSFPHEPAGRVSWIPAAILAPLVALPLVIHVSDAKDGFMSDIYRSVVPMRTFNSYGLFAVMTTERMEIMVEGSIDGREWKRYSFNHKPSQVDVRPDFATPHMPRLDWQMWFASLGTCEHNSWFVSFQEHLLLGTPDVLGLLDEVPFEEPPRFIRTPTFDYRFGNDAWWSSTARDEHYCPPLTIREGELRRAVINASN